MNTETKIDDGGPAFPPYWDPKTHPHGMKLRAYIATSVLQGMYAFGTNGESYNPEHTDANFREATKGDAGPFWYRYDDGRWVCPRSISDAMPSKSHVLAASWQQRLANAAVAQADAMIAALKAGAT